MAEKKIDLKLGVEASGKPSEDLINFLSKLGVTPSENKDFYREFENFLSSGSGAIDLDNLADKFISILSSSSKVKQVTPFIGKEPSTNNEDIQVENTAEISKQSESIPIDQATNIIKDTNLESVLITQNKRDENLSVPIAEENKLDGSQYEIGEKSASQRKFSQIVAEAELKGKITGLEIQTDTYKESINAIERIKDEKSVAPENLDTAAQLLSSTPTGTKETATPDNDTLQKQNEKITEQTVVNAEILKNRNKIEENMTVRGLSGEQRTFSRKNSYEQSYGSMLGQRFQNIRKYISELIKNNKDNAEKKIDLFLYTVMPYTLAGTVQRGLNFLQGKGEKNRNDPSAANFLSAARSVITYGQRARYFSIDELAYFTTSALSFYTLLLKRGITIKDMSAGKFGFGVAFNVSLMQARISKDKAQKQLGEKEHSYRLSYVAKRDEEEKAQDKVIIGVDGDGYKENEIRQEIQEAGEKIKVGYAEPAQKDVPSRKDDPKKVEELKKQADADDGEKIKSGYAAPAQKDTPEESDNPIDEQLPDIILQDILRVKNIIEIGTGRERNKYSTKYDDGTNSLSLEKNGELGSSNEIEFGKEEYDYVDYDRTIKRNQTFNDVLNKMRERSDYWKIGSLYIWPVVDSSVDMTPKKIPFQFNPVISEASIVARYQATQILSRIGNLQSFLGTDSLTVTLATKYYPVAKDITKTDNFPTNPEDGWLSLFDMKTIQFIEMGYRALKLPVYMKTDTEIGYKYFKPPLVKVIMGDWRKEGISSNAEDLGSNPISNLLAYPHELVNDKIESDPNAPDGLRRFKTFIVTSVEIARDYEGSPFYMDDQGVVRDTMGFSVSLNMTEVSPSYADIMPNFKDYYDYVMKAYYDKRG